MNKNADTEKKRKIKLGILEKYIDVYPIREQKDDERNNIDVIITGSGYINDVDDIETAEYYLGKIPNEIKQLPNKAKQVSQYFKPKAESILNKAYDAVTSSDIAKEYVSKIMETVFAVGTSTALAEFGHAPGTEDKVTITAKNGKLSTITTDPRAIVEKTETYLMDRAEKTGWMDYNVTKITEKLEEALKSDKSAYEITQELKETLENRAETITHTELAYVREKANDEVMQMKNVRYVQYITARDEITCEECDDLDGNIYEIENAPTLPMHPHCRCTLVPYDTETNGKNE